MKERVAREVTTVKRMPDRPGNVVFIIAHGWLSDQYSPVIGLHVYYVNAERGDFTLEEYINYHRGQSDLPINEETIERSNSAVRTKNYSALERAGNAWTIGGQIASGLSCLHAEGILHTALKPGSGTLVLEV
jgi:serine/threonine protein kinase